MGMMHILRISALVAATHAALSVTFPVQARACSFAFLEHFVDADEVEVDTTPPAAPVIGEVLFHRSPDGSSQNGCSQSASSCDGTGTIGISIDVAADDRTAEADMGYLIEITSGELPDEFFLPTEPVRADESGIIWLPFSDHGQDIDFAFSVQARDLGGNLGEPAVVQVSDSGPQGGCSAGASAGPASLALVLLALAAALRRRRRVFAG
jgi:uncharacterized protein (TIGR03382 family)